MTQVEEVLSKLNGIKGRKCLEFSNGHITKDGYCTVATKKKGKKDVMTASRFVYEATHGKLLPGYVVRHSCDNPL